MRTVIIVDMKRSARVLSRFTAVLLSCVLLVSFVNVSVLAVKSFEKAVGDIVEFGNYPQSLVTDSKLIATLNDQPGDWYSFGYYYGDGAIGTGNHYKTDFMLYRDISYQNEKYRAVYYTEYRPRTTAYRFDNQYYFGHESFKTKKVIYWFKYEPIKWRVLDPARGLLLSELVIDAQPINNTVFRERYGYKFYKDAAHSIPATDWSSCDLRQWLNQDFYRIAFADNQKSLIADTKLENAVYSGNGMGRFSVNGKSKATTDKVFLLAAPDAFNTAYGFPTVPSNHEYNHPCDWGRTAGLTAYASCLKVDDGLRPVTVQAEFDPDPRPIEAYIKQHFGTFGAASWWTRSAENSLDGNSTLSCGMYMGSAPVCRINGVRPAITVDPKKDLDPPKSIATMYGDVDLDGKVTAKDARLALRYSARLETLSAIQIANAAVINQDNTTVTAADARKILRYSAKLEPSFPTVKGSSTAAHEHKFTGGDCQHYATCSICGAKSSSLGDHQWGDWIDTLAGVEGKKCAVCNEWSDQTRYHNYDTVVTNPAGTHHIHMCSGCGSQLTRGGHRIELDSAGNCIYCQMLEW